MYEEMERVGTNLNEIDGTDCENSLESLQVGYFECFLKCLYSHIIVDYFAANCSETAPSQAPAPAHGVQQLRPSHQQP